MLTRLRQRLPALLRAAALLPRALLSPRHTPPRLRFVYVETGASTRYRVDHHIEQARIAGLFAEAIPLEDAARLYDLAATDVIYIHRLPLAALTLPLVVAARLRRIPLIYDTDDLVWDERDREYHFLEQRYDEATIERTLRTSRANRRMMRLADALALSTPYLARLAAADLRRPAYASANVLSQQQLALAQQAYEQRPAQSAHAPVIGYFCGYAHVHDEDVATIGAALAETLERTPSARLRIYGEVTLPAELAAAQQAGRIELLPVVSWNELPRHIAGVDVNIAPLVDNPQRRGKSGIKYLEAAAVGVPTVAVRLEPYADVISDGVTGILATTHAEWVQGLTRLLQDAAFRRTMGEAARADVLARHTTERQAASFRRMIEEIVK